MKGLWRTAGRPLAEVRLFVSLIIAITAGAGSLHPALPETMGRPLHEMQGWSCLSGLLYEAASSCRFVPITVRLIQGDFSVVYRRQSGEQVASMC